ncbi:MAG: ABC transporter substrate-binding protein [Candidatus Wallbacteria bacterium]|nr:ABC transporter substrate-binding protein [Candidatus Wallbacteria bacterium]
MNKGMALILISALFFCCFSQAASNSAAPVFSLAWSEWPGWSVFGVAHEIGLIDGASGKMGPVEKQYNVDIELKEMEYDPCIAAYGAGQVDAACLTNMDTLPCCGGRSSVAILPNDTSNGGDMCITIGINRVEDLKGKTVYGLEKSVSQYLFSRYLEMKNIPENDVKWVNMDPGAAALAMQQGNKQYEAIVVWNPFCLQTLNTRKDAKVLFDSSAIPGEIVDMVVVAKDSLAREGGDNFGLAVVDTYFKVMQRLEDPKTAYQTLVMIGEKFSNLDLEQMKKVRQGTKYITTAEEALNFFRSHEFTRTMVKVIDFCVSHQVIEKAPVWGGGDYRYLDDTDMIFDHTFVRRIAEAGKSGKAKP